MKADLIAFNCRYSHSCLAIFYLRNELEKHLSAISTRIRQFTINDPYFETLLQITGSNADVLFFSVYIWNSDYISRLLSDIHKATPRKMVVLGGPQAPRLAETLSFPTTVVHGEIEGISPYFYTDILSHTLQQQYICSPAANFDFPYLKPDFEDQLKNRNIYYESTRGCPFSCSYCLSSASTLITSKDVSTVQEELALLIQQSPKIIRFVDRTFNANPARALAIWQYILSHSPPSICYHFEIAPDIFSEEMFSFLATVPSGFFQFEIGIQSTHTDTLQAVHRKMDISKAFQTIRRLLVLNTIHLHIDLILGLPFDSSHTFFNSFKDVFSLHPHYIQMGLLKVLPATGIETSSAEFEIESCQQPPYQVLSTKWLKHQELSYLYFFGECFESFYNNRYFRNFFRYIAANNFDSLSFFKGLLNLSMDKNFFQLAKTQPFMNEILLEYILTFSENNLLQELLIFDWLSCGHRYLPKGVKGDLNAIRNSLYAVLPETLPGLFDKQNRKYFLKKSVFFIFSQELISFTGVAETKLGGYVGFLQEENHGIFDTNKSVYVGYY